jgi:hypothetical protein
VAEKCLGYRGTGADVTALLRVQEALRESERSARSAIDGIAGLIAIMAPNGEIETVNRQVFAHANVTHLRNDQGHLPFALLRGENSVSPEKRREVITNFKLIGVTALSLALALASPAIERGGGGGGHTFCCGSERVVAHYNLMGPEKAALESAVRYTAAELGAKGFARMPSRLGRSVPELPAESTASMNCSMSRRPPRRSTIWLISTTSVLSPRSWSATARATLPVRSSPSMAGST